MKSKNDHFDIRKISWVNFSKMKKTTVSELIQLNQNSDNIRLENLQVEGMSDLAEVNLGILLGFRTEAGLHVRFKSKFENRDLFVRVSAQLHYARTKNIKVSIGGAYRKNNSFYAVYFQIESKTFDFLEKIPDFRISKERIPYLKLQKTSIAELMRKSTRSDSLKFTAKIISISGLGSDYAFVLLGCIAVSEGTSSPKLEIVFTAKGTERDKFVDLNADLDWACEKQISVEFGGDFDGKYFIAYYFKIQSDVPHDRKGALINLR